MASRGRRSGGGANRNRPPPKIVKSNPRPENVDESSPVIQAFYGFQAELDARHDKHERIVKISRDITIESKRAIFLLQRCAGNADQAEVLSQALGKIKEIQQTKFLPLAQELDGHDHYHFLRAYSPGLQEYIEAVSFYHYLKTGHLISLAAVQEDLKFPRPSQAADPACSGAAASPSVTSDGQTAPSSETVQKASSSIEQKEKTSDETDDPTAKKRHAEPGFDTSDIMVTVPPMEFMLGIADLTGELMRTAIMSVSAGDLDFPKQICKFMRIIHDAFMSYGNTARELTKKMWTLQQSLQKVENACYTLRVRGSEIPKHMLADVFSGSSTEGFFADLEDSTTPTDRS